VSRLHNQIAESLEPTFLKPNFSEVERLRFYDGAFSTSFTKWLIQNIYNVSTLVCLWEQALGIEAARKAPSRVTRENRIGLPIIVVRKLCTTLSISFGSLSSHAKNECELKM
jgi:hypothetical protein